MNDIPDSERVFTFKPTGFNRTATMEVADPQDVIQKCHARGAFYSEPQLLEHRNYILHGTRVLDIGANVGNHTIFYGMFTQAAEIIPFEPNPVARDLLQKNIGHNPTARVNTEFCHLGLGRSQSFGTIKSRSDINLGMARVDLETSGEIEIVPLDSLELTNISFIKIDVEGMELDVLSGAERTLRENRPIIAIEIDGPNNAAFFDWCDSFGYQVVSVSRPHRPFDYICVARF